MNSPLRSFEKGAGFFSRLTFSKLNDTDLKLHLIASSLAHVGI